MERAVYYARVSTQEEQQLKALPKQVEECENCITSNGWILTDGYVDEGKSGTKVKGRDEYQRLLEDIELDKFDIIVVKSQDRLQRNTKDWYIFVDKLVTNNIKLYMYLENTFYTTDNALITGIKAILAEEYSRDLSKKLNNANKRRIEHARSGEHFNCMGSGQTYGFSISNGEWFVDEKQAVIVKEAFNAYKRFKSVNKTRDYLNDSGYRNQAGRLFSADTIRRILRNEMHKGILVLNRSHREFNSKKIIKHPKEEWVYVENRIPPIVDAQLWDEVNSMLDKNVLLYEGKAKRGKNTGKYPLSAKVYCSCCGKPMWKRGTYQSNGVEHIQWVCSEYQKRGNKGCSNHESVSDIFIRGVYKSISDNLSINRNAVKQSIIGWLERLKEELTKNSDLDNIENSIAKIKAKKEKLTDAYMDAIISKEDYKMRYALLEKEETDLQRHLAPLEDNEDIKSILNILANIDSEIDLYINSKRFDECKIDWLFEHTKRITVVDKHLIIELDLIAGAILAGKDFFLFAMDGLPKPVGRIYNEAHCKKSGCFEKILYRIKCNKHRGNNMRSRKSDLSAGKTRA